MSLFSVELPLRDGLTREDFVAQIIIWLKGVRGCTLFSSGVPIDEDGGVHLISDSGESLNLKECKIFDGFAVGAVHETPDNLGRFWRTEITFLARPGRSALSIRSQCLVSDAGEAAQTPKKPYIIKMVIDDGWLSMDGRLSILQSAHYSDDDDIDLDFIKSLVCRPTLLPIVVLFCDAGGQPYLGVERASRLAFELGGLAHVIVVQGSDLARSIFENYGDARADSMAYIAYGRFGFIRRYRVYENKSRVFDHIINSIVDLNSTRKPVIGWSLQDIADELMRQAQSAYREQNAGLDDLFSSMQDALIEKDRIIESIRIQLHNLMQSSVSDDCSGDYFRDNLNSIGEQLYDGEFMDRIRILVGVGIKATELDLRTKEFGARFLQKIPATVGSEALVSKIKAAGKGGKDAESGIISILKELGFIESREANHRVLKPGNLFGLAQQTFSCTPSDYRSGQNAAARVIRDLKLRELGGS